MNGIAWVISCRKGTRRLENKSQREKQRFEKRDRDSREIPLNVHTERYNVIKEGSLLMSVKKNASNLFNIHKGLFNGPRKLLRFHFDLVTNKWSSRLTGLFLLNCQNGQKWSKQASKNIGLAFIFYLPTQNKVYVHPLPTQLYCLFSPTS